MYEKLSSVGLDMGIFFVEDVYISADGDMKEEIFVLYMSQNTSNLFKSNGGGATIFKVEFAL